MFSRRRTRHTRGMTDASSRSMSIPDVTGDATARYENNSHSGTTWYDLMPTPANGTDSTAIVATITGITQAPIGVVTTAAPHGLANDTRVLIAGVAGMTQVNNTLFTVMAAAATTFELHTAENAPVPVDTLAFGAYTGGGTASQGAMAFPYYVGSSSIEIGAPAKLNFADAFTLCAWANMDIVTPPLQGNEAIIYKSDRAIQLDVAFTIADTNGQVTGGIYAPGGKFVQSGAGFGGAWRYFVFVNEGAGNDLKLFIDGVLINTSAGDGGAVTWDAAVPWYFGRTAAVGALIAQDFFQGQIDTGRFYSRALSADEILRDYNAGLPAHQ